MTYNSERWHEYYEDRAQCKQEKLGQLVQQRHTIDTLHGCECSKVLEYDYIALAIHKWMRLMVNMI
jgi:hypothetical protein